MFKIMGKYKNKKEEEIDTAKTIREANYLMREYAMAFGPDWVIWQEEKKARKR